MVKDVIHYFCVLNGDVSLSNIGSPSIPVHLFSFVTYHTGSVPFCVLRYHGTFVPDPGSEPRGETPG